jgi:electron transport complex protein RnfC
MPCIRCGACAEACPHELQPFEMYWFSRAKNFGKTQEYNIFDCIECGCCSYVCPRTFRWSSTSALPRARSGRASAKRMPPSRHAPNANEKAERLEGFRGAESRAATNGRKGRESRARRWKPTDTAAARKASIAAAIERARAQREAAQPKNTDVLTAEQKQQVAAVEARRGGGEAASGGRPEASTRPPAAGE